MADLPIIGDPECGRCEQVWLCGRCGSSVGHEDCEMCPATGWYDEPDPRCPVCFGTGIAHFCLSTHEFCQANPLTDRDHVERPTVENYTFAPCAAHVVSGRTGRGQ